MAKYIKTKDKKIIVFSGLNNHSDFRVFNPVSAGFINFYNEGGETKVSCYGESISLEMKSDPEEDTILANFQLLKY